MKHLLSSPIAELKGPCQPTQLTRHRTSLPTALLRSCATRRATLTAATLLGWVTATALLPTRPASRRICDICVVFPARLRHIRSKIQKESSPRRHCCVWRTLRQTERIAPDPVSPMTTCVCVRRPTRRRWRRKRFRPLCKPLWMPFLAACKLQGQTACAHRHRIVADGLRNVFGVLLHGQLCARWEEERVITFHRNFRRPAISSVVGRHGVCELCARGAAIKRPLAKNNPKVRAIARARSDANTPRSSIASGTSVVRR